MDCHIPVVSESIASFHQVNTKNCSFTRKINAFLKSAITDTRTRSLMIKLRLSLPGNAQRVRGGEVAYCSLECALPQVVECSIITHTLLF